jgi:hypothetical protein
VLQPPEVDALDPLPVIPTAMLYLKVRVVDSRPLPRSCPFCGCRSFWRSEDGDPQCMLCARDPRGDAHRARVRIA